MKMADKPSRGPFLRQTLISLTIVAISFCAGLIEAGGQEQLLKISESEESDVIFKELVDWRSEYRKYHYSKIFKSLKFVYAASQILTRAPE
ncbi:hypothetical protein MSG28_012642 [Choristoneura fumiferana]|uniref:Uncharacterized protein n=1 Tax=Choristoneura fumiferana TaxID=7141 RepID=A0ACC0JI65_CHOFU|nr:hypothetical protein MSG28_012642 [Choristoneura fumiferana]